MKLLLQTWKKRKRYKMTIKKIEHKGASEGNVILSFTLPEFNQLYNAIYAGLKDGYRDELLETYKQMRFVRDILNYGIVTDTVVAATCGISREKWGKV